MKLKTIYVATQMRSRLNRDIEYVTQSNTFVSPTIVGDNYAVS